MSMPLSGSIPPGAPTPTPTSESVARPASSAAAPSDCAIASTTSTGPPSVGVGTRDWPSTLSRSSRTTVWIFVPPRSTPARGGMAPSISDSAHVLCSGRAVGVALRAITRYLDRVGDHLRPAARVLLDLIGHPGALGIVLGCKQSLGVAPDVL